MSIQKRPATSQEIFDHYRVDRRVRFRHFVREIFSPRATNGVAHRQYNSGKLQSVDGVPSVRHQGAVQPLRATHYTLDTGTTFIADLRLDSDYL